MPVYVGLDCSTQSLSAVAIEVGTARRRVLFEHTLSFDEALPYYGTKKGVLPSTDPLVMTSSPLMWAEALDRMMGVIATNGGFELARLAAISGSAQQHGSVYLHASATGVLASLDPARPLVEQLAGSFTRDSSPVWMDASTSAQCTEISTALGGDAALARLTGSRAFERFTGPQIRKFYRSEPRAYERTDRIHLVSSYLASLLAGAHAPIDPGDGAGMNLMDLRRARWADAALDATAPGLRKKLPDLELPWTVIGRLAPYWVRRYGFPPSKVVVWSGDNPCSLIGAGIVRPGNVAISLGTSDTLFALMAEPRVDPAGTAHVFGAPTGDYMSLICFRNGSLARERVRDAHGLDWDGFSRALRETPAGNRGRILIPWFEPEITPTVLAPDVRRYGLEPDDAAANVRAVVEAQMMAMAIHSTWTGNAVERIHATGGAARNREILQVMADVFAAPVYPLEAGNSASLGAALRAAHADALDSGHAPPWDDIVAGFAPLPDAALRPDPRNVEVYRALRPVYAACEAHSLHGTPDPALLLTAFRERQQR